MKTRKKGIRSAKVIRNDLAMLRIYEHDAYTRLMQGLIVELKNNNVCGDNMKMQQTHDHLVKLGLIN